MATAEQELRTREDQTAGSLLRATRQQLGEDLAAVAEALRIRLPYLAAIEDGRFKDLPGPTYAVGFVRTYAEYLGLDPADVVQRFRDEAAAELRKRPELVFPSPVSEGRIPGGAVLFLGLVLAGAAYGGWYWMSSQQASVAELVPELPDRLAALVGKPPAGEPAPAPMPAAAPANEPPPPTEQPPEPAPEAAPPAAPAPAAETPPPTEPAPVPPAEVAAPIVAPPEPETAPPAAEAAPPAAPGEASLAAADGTRTYGENNVGSRITLSAVEDCWIQVRDAGGELLLTRLLRKGDRYLVPNRPGLTLMTGSAGALEVRVDGAVAPPLGRLGEVRRDVALDATKLLGQE